MLPLWSYWALFFAVIGISLLVAAWLDARDGAPAPVGTRKPADAPASGRTSKPPAAFERTPARAIEAIDVPSGPVDPLAQTMEIDRSQALGGMAAETPPSPPKREDDGPARE